MIFPEPGKYIDIHTHGSTADEEVFFIQNLMADEDLMPDDIYNQPCSYGIHPWNLEKDNSDNLLLKVKNAAGCKNLMAIGEAGYDKLKGPDLKLQNEVFMAQAILAEEYRKPMIIHCVKAWDELIAVHRKLKPTVPWLVHGFRGSIELANQLIARGFWLSFWYDFILRSESSGLIRSVSQEKIFVETDGADIKIQNIYLKVADDLSIPLDAFKILINRNFVNFFTID